MSERKYFVLCEDNCKFESMTKEQIYAAIMQAAETGEIANVDAGFITKVQEQNGGRNLFFWLGTTAEYNALAEKLENCLYIKTDDTFERDMTAKMDALIEYAKSTIGRVTPPIEICITTDEGATIVCTDARGEVYEPTRRTATTWVIPVGEYGVYTISGEYSGLTHTETVTVDTVKQYHIAFAFYNDNFGANDWDTIIKLCKHNAVPDAWKVGDGKTVTYTFMPGEYVYNESARIIAKHHDTDASGHKTPLTLLVKGWWGVNSKTSSMTLSSVESTNAGGWEACLMRTDRMARALAAMPAELQAGIKEVKKHTSAGAMSAEIVETTDKLFLLSEVEANGTTTYSAAGEGEQYDFFKAGNTVFNDNERVMWTRSPHIGDAYQYCYSAKNSPYVGVADSSTEINYWIAFCL